MMYVVPFEQAIIASIYGVSARWRGTGGCARRNRITPRVIVDVVIDNLGWASAPIQDAVKNAIFDFIVDKPHIRRIACVDDVTGGKITVDDKTVDGNVLDLPKNNMTPRGICAKGRLPDYVPGGFGLNCHPIRVGSAAWIRTDGFQISPGFHDQRISS